MAGIDATALKPRPNQLIHMTTNPTAVDGPHTDGETNAYYVLGGEHLGSAVADRLRADGHSVCVVDESHDRSHVPGVRGDPSDVRALEAADVGSATTAVVCTGSDRRNLLVAQLVRAHFDVETVVVLANDPDRIDLFTEAGHAPVCATSVLSDALLEAI